MDDPFALHLAQGDPGAAPAAATAQQLAAPDAADFGEVPVGEAPKKDLYVFNLHESGPSWVSASLAGDSQFALISPVPESLRPSREGLGAPFRLIYQAEKPGRFEANLTVRAAWPEYTGWKPDSLRIPIRGLAYLYGEEPPSEVAAEQAREAARQKEADGEKALDAELDREVVRDNAVDAPYPQGAENLLDDAFIRASRALELMTDLQAVGIDVAEGEAADYRRKMEMASPGLAALLAMQALDMATYGLAGTVSSWARAAMSKTLTMPPAPTLRRGVPVPPPADAQPITLPRVPLPLAINISESLKLGLRNAGKAAKEALLGEISGGGPSSSQTVSSEDRRNFFADQKSALANSKSDRAQAVADSMRRLRPLMRGKNPGSAAAAMQAIAGGLEAGAKEARNVQADETRFAWMRFLSQIELGSLSEEEARRSGLKPSRDGQPPLNLATALNLPKEHEDLPRYDGVLDLEISADYFNPLETMQIRSARMNGVTPGTARPLSLLPISRLLEKGVVVRVTIASPGVAAMPVVAVFDGDRIAFMDETGAPGEQPHWLSKLDGYVGRPSPERQRLGARVLRDRLKARTLTELGLAVQTDHDG